MSLTWCVRSSAVNQTNGMPRGSAILDLLAEFLCLCGHLGGDAATAQLRRDVLGLGPAARRWPGATSTAVGTLPGG